MNKKEKMLINAKFRFNNNEYLLLTNNKCQKFYLKLDSNNKIDLVSLEEYAIINKALFGLKKQYGYTTIEIEPLMRLKKGLVSLSVAGSILLTLSGCSKGIDKTTKGLENIGIETSVVNDEFEIYRMTKANLGEKVEYANINFSSLSDTPFSLICTPSDFGKYVGKSNVSFDDLRTTLKNNSNVPEEIKIIINEGIDNLERENFNINYSALDYNLERLTVEYVEPQEINNTSGVFDHFTSKVKVSNKINDKQDFSKDVLIHEIIGHGSTGAYDKEKGVICSIEPIYLIMDKDGSIYDLFNYGSFGNEGIADIITSVATNKKIKPGKGYTTNVYELATLCSSVGISVEDYANYGVEYLTEKMLEHGIENPYQLLTTLDNKTSLLLQNALIQSNSTELFMDYYKELSDNNSDNDELKESTLAYNEYVETEEMQGMNIIMRMKDDDTFDFIQPDIVTDYVNNLGNTKSFK